jgi:hypothetical protein
MMRRFVNTGFRSANQVEVDFTLGRTQQKEAVDFVDRIRFITRTDRKFSKFTYPILAIRYPFLANLGVRPVHVEPRESEEFADITRSTI